MKKHLLIVLYICFAVSTITGQMVTNNVLFTVDEDPVYVDEFKRVYNKNLDLVKDDSQKDVDTYLELFINYKLKLKEAKAMELHEKPKYKREFASYRKQLTKNYLTDTDVTEALVREAYERTSYEVRASHILIRIPENAPDEDTLKAYNKLRDIKKEIIAGLDFVSAAKKYSEDPTAAENGGDLGYFGGFRMVYDFENAAFNTKIGEVSTPFRTKFGYHMVKVIDRRKSKGELTVAHIMVSNKKQTDSLVQPEDRINDIYKKLQQGESFESLAMQFSEDKASAKKGGRLNRFGKGQLSSPEFEDAAFNLTENDDISKPVKTNFGWHIIKLIEKHPVSSFEDMRSELEAKIKRGSRSKIISTSFINTLKRKYELKRNQDAINYFADVMTDDFYNRTWTVPEKIEKNKTLLNIAKKTLTYEDFANYLVALQRKMNTKESFETIVSKAYDDYVGKEVLKYYEDHLEEENEDFKIIVEEYRDGLLLFDLMESEIWNAARKDSVGLKSYFEKNTLKYHWKRRIVATVASSVDESIIKKVSNYLKKGWSADKIKETINQNGKLGVIFTKDTMAANHQALPKEFKFKKGVSDILKHNEAFIVGKVDDIINQKPKTFKEARGPVISDYQAYIEKNWLKSLRKKYKVNVKPVALQRAKKEMTN